MEIQLRTATGVKALLFEKARVSITPNSLFLAKWLQYNLYNFNVDSILYVALYLLNKIIFNVVRVEYYNNLILKQLNSITVTVYEQVSFRLKSLTSFLMACLVNTFYLFAFCHMQTDYDINGLANYNTFIMTKSIVHNLLFVS